MSHEFIPRPVVSYACILYVSHMLTSYVCLICLHHMCVSYTCDRYIWGYRFALARSFHDTVQQMHSPSYTEKTFAPLSKWLHKVKTPAEHLVKRQKLQKFKRADQELFKLFASCLRAHATNSHLPWGRATIQSESYLEINPEEKVLPPNTIQTDNLLFFLAFAFC